jgi:phosphopantetheinyl transferase
VTPGKPLGSGQLSQASFGVSLLALRRDGAGAQAVELGPRERALLHELREWPLRQAEWLAGRAVSKQLLHQAFALEPGRVEILPAQSGAPLVSFDGIAHPLRLSLSHTERWAVAAAAPFAVGVDVADDEDGERLPRIARRVFSEGEAEECGAHLSLERAAAVWALKEAGLKLRIGGVFSPGARSVRVQSLSPVRVADPTMELELFRLDGAALAVARERPQSTSAAPT